MLRREIADGGEEAAGGDKDNGEIPIARIGRRAHGIYTAGQVAAGLGRIAVENHDIGAVGQAGERQHGVEAVDGSVKRYGLPRRDAGA